MNLIRLWMVGFAIALSLWVDLSPMKAMGGAIHARDGVPGRRVGGGTR